MPAMQTVGQSEVDFSKSGQCAFRSVEQRALGEKVSASISRYGELRESDERRLSFGGLADQLFDA